MHFEFLISTYGMLQHFCSILWTAITMPLAGFIPALLTIVPGSAGLLAIWNKVIEFAGAEFLYQVTFLDMMFGAGLAVVIIFNVIKFIMGVLPIV